MFLSTAGDGGAGSTSDARSRLSILTVKVLYRFHSLSLVTLLLSEWLEIIYYLVDRAYESKPPSTEPFLLLLLLLVIFSSSVCRYPSTSNNSLL